MAMSPTTFVRYVNGQGNIRDQLRSIGSECFAKYQLPPNLYVVILPEGGNDIYTAVKQCVVLLFSVIFFRDRHFIPALEILRSVFVQLHVMITSAKAFRLIDGNPDPMHEESKVHASKATIFC
jgi:hypothetical protein